MNKQKRTTVLMGLGLTMLVAAGQMSGMPQQRRSAATPAVPANPTPNSAASQDNGSNVANAAVGRQIYEFTTSTAAVEAAAKQFPSTGQAAVNAAESTTDRTATETASAAKDAQDTASDFGLKNASNSIGKAGSRLGGVFNRGKKTQEATKKTEARVEKNTDRIGLTGGVDLEKGAGKVLADYVRGLSHDGSTPVVVVYGNRQQAEVLKNSFGQLPAELVFVDVIANKARDSVYEIYAPNVGQVWVWKDGKDAPTEKMDAFAAMGGQLAKALSVP